MATGLRAQVLDVLPVISLSFFFIAQQEYEEDVKKLRLKVDDTERRLGAIFCQAFDDAPGLEHIFKVQDTVVSACLSPAYKDVHTWKCHWAYLMFAAPGYVW